MNGIDKQQILVLLTNWMQVTDVLEKKDKMIIRGYLQPGETPQLVQSRIKPLVPKLRYQQTGGMDSFTVYLQKTIVGIPRINLLLFIATVFTTLLAGALMEGVNPVENPAGIMRGIPFSLTLLLILGVHETGHFLTARKHHVDATLPYFLPAPTIIGTFGAFIKMRSPVRRRRALVEIGAAGPVAGFIVAVPALFIGLSLSSVASVSAQAGVQLGESIIMKIATGIIYPGLPEHADIMLHPVGFAAWIGMLVTMLNLLPIGQLDGGHIAYALLGKWYSKVAWGALVAILLLSLLSPNWLIWAVLVYFLTRMKHPPIMDESKPVTRREKWIGITAGIIFILTFIPVPFKF